mmetsp:Transcript_8057/g.23660  ORF Transcript_8057/g.23660 Transcript_8057/m.23660 type:complete len:269 (+) Transcript_8057:165-971(+)
MASRAARGIVWPTAAYTLCICAAASVTRSSYLTRTYTLFVSGCRSPTSRSRLASSEARVRSSPSAMSRASVRQTSIAQSLTSDLRMVSGRPLCELRRRSWRSPLGSCTMCIMLSGRPDSPSISSAAAAARCMEPWRSDVYATIARLQVRSPALQECMDSLSFARSKLRCTCLEKNSGLEEFSWESTPVMCRRSLMRRRPCGRSQGQAMCTEALRLQVSAANVALVSASARSSWSKHPALCQGVAGSENTCMAGSARRTCMTSAALASS